MSPNGLLCVTMDPSELKKSSNIAVPSRDRKDVEKSRRIRMKNLFHNLQSLIPTLNSTGMSTNGQLEHAKAYIEELVNKVEGMKKRKEELQMCIEGNCGITKNIIEVREVGSTLEVVAITTGLNGSSLLSDIISVLNEEGAEVVNANFYKVGGITYHTIHSQAYCSRVGVETDRVCERLKELE